MAGLGIDLLKGLFVGMLKIAGTFSVWMYEHVHKPVIDFFKNVGSWLYDKGKSLIQGQLRGMLVIAATVTTWFTTHIFNPVNNFFRNAPSWLYNEGKSIIQGQLRGMLIIASTISSWISSHVKGPLISALKTGGTWLYNGGKAIINGMLSGLVAAWKTVTGWVKTLKDKLVSAITSVFKISSPARTMIPLGMHIMNGLIKGMISSRSALKTVVKSIFHSTSDVIKRGGDLLGGLFEKGLGALGLGPSKPVGSAQQFAQLYMRSKYGWGGGNWPALKALWMGESGWRYNALNKSSGAYGIPQSLPASKMASAGSDWRTNPATQIKWGLSYIKSRYGSPMAAYSAWLRRSPHWYDAGGIARGVGAMLKGTLSPERVLSPRQTVAFENLVDTLAHPAASGGTTIINATFENHGVIGSKRETEDWLVTSFGNLQRTGRIRVVTK
jgi:hypothetical protein